MTDVIKAVLLGILEGLTEFIPVSSTGHLIIVGDALAFPQPLSDTFNVAIQLGAILAVLFIHYRYFAYFLSPKHWLSERTKVVAIAILPALVSGFFFYSIIKTYLFSPTTVILALFLGGIGLIFADRLNTSSEDIDVEAITPKQALVIGLFQCLALWPGMSRSGATIFGGIMAGLSVRTAANFSFIIAVPVMVAAVGYDLLKTMGSLGSNDYVLIGIGFSISFLVAYLSIVTFLKLLDKWRLSPFGWYRIVLSVILGVLYWL